MDSQPRKIDIKASDEDLKGRYSNFMKVVHKKEECFLDFFLITDPVGQMVGRIITSPGHMKRIAVVLNDTIKKYEEQFGKIKETSGPEGEIGFRGTKQNK